MEISFDIHAVSECRVCDGKGNRAIIIDIPEFMKIVDASISPRRIKVERNKIQAIKDVRERWALGLREAKNLVESYQTFINIIEKRQ